MTNLDFAQIVAPIDVRVCVVDLNVLRLIRRLASSNPELDPGEAIERGDITLDKMCQVTRLSKPHVFAAVALLEGSS